MSVRRRMPVAERFEGKYCPEPNSGCWLWTGAATSNGQSGYYGNLGGAGSIDHLCRNTLCVNPDHLEAVTHTENVRRGHLFRQKQKQAAA